MTDFSWGSKEERVCSWCKYEPWIILSNDKFANNFTTCLIHCPTYFTDTWREKEGDGHWCKCDELLMTIILDKMMKSCIIFNLSLNILFTDTLWDKEQITNWCKCEETYLTSVKALSLTRFLYLLKFSTNYIGRRGEKEEIDNCKGEQRTVSFFKWIESCIITASHSTQF